MQPIILCVFFTILFTTGISQQLVMRGDHADPSVVKIGDTYWASATSSNWFPAYPLLKSKDLVNWKMQGYVFDKLPTWTDFYFWAPEISYENGKVYIYYSAHKKDGNLCLGIASADKPEGPYKDHGPLMCQPVGSIDAFPMRDENGKLFIIWKEDGNSVNKPTPIWAQQMNEERTAFVGEKKEIFRNDKGWEGNLVEGVSMIKKGEYYYAFYAAAGCCGRECTYQTGVARSKTLLGPWEKYSKNPILTNDDEWKCPGHGTPIEKDGKYYFLYHAYDKETDVYTGREGLLIEFKFTPDGWIEFVRDNNADIPVTDFNDNFRGKNISHSWQYSVFEKPGFLQKRGSIILYGSSLPSGSFLGTKTTSGNYSATVKLKANRTNTNAGIAIIGDEKNIISALYKDGLIRVLQLKDGKETELENKTITKSKNIFLKMEVTNGKNITFLYSNNDKDYQQLNNKTIDGSFLPPWDRSLRVGLVTKGSTKQYATFDKFELDNK